MCGILGIVHAGAINLDKVSASFSKIARRGPDHMGLTQIGQDSCFAHARLSIVDLSEKGNQPYCFENLVITFNGMIYNYLPLREELRSAGYNFESSSDTEVLIKAWHWWGPEALHRLDGFFSFGLYDKRQECLFLCRDKIGKKPLYWREWHGGLAFASRLDAIETLTKQEQLCTDAIQWLFYLKYIPEPLSALKNVHKIERGGLLRFDKTGVKIERWGSIKGVDYRSSSHAAVTDENLKFSIEKAVSSRLVADVPVSCLLSGGIDSTIISTIASRSVKLNTFTLAIESKRNTAQFNESAIAHQTAKIIKSDHHEIMLNERAIADSMEHLFEQVFDEPIADPAAALNHQIFRKVSSMSKVCLTGDGADEVFGGYRRHQGQLLSNHIFFNNKITKFLIRPLSSLVPDRRDNWALEKLRLVARYLQAVEHTSTSGQAWLTNPDIIGSMFSNDFDHVAALNKKVEGTQLSETDADQINKMLAFEVASTIPNQMMVKVDRTSMDSGVEVRSPFLDQQVVELAFTRNGGDKVRIGRGKAILRSIFKAELPSHVVKQRKRGFDLPIMELLEGPLRNHLEDASCRDFHAQIGIRSATVERWLADAKNHRSHSAANHLWTLIGLKIWHAKQ